MKVKNGLRKLAIYVINMLKRYEGEGFCVFTSADACMRGCAGYHAEGWLCAEDGKLYITWTGAHHAWPPPPETNEITEEEAIKHLVQRFKSLMDRNGWNEYQLERFIKECVNDEEMQRKRELRETDRKYAEYLKEQMSRWHGRR